MYRLHNLGIERKIDWLIKNGKLQRKKVIIFPWKEDSIHMYNYLSQKWGSRETIIIDDEVSQYNNDILSTKALDTYCLDDSYVGLIISDTDNFVELLKEKGMPYENIFIIKGDPLTAQDALIKCGEDKLINTVLDVGCGNGNHSGIFLEYGKRVTGIDAGFTCRIKEKYNFKFIHDEFVNHIFSESYDLVWCAHVLEHQLAVGKFIKKLFSCCKDDGKVAITVPNQTDMVIEGHVNNWNAGLLMYNIIQCGYSCKHAAIKTYAGNVSVILPKEEIDRCYDYRAISDSRKYFPDGMQCGSTRFGGIYFNGDIEELNWKFMN